MKKDKKKNAKTIKGAIIEIIVSLIVLVGFFALSVYDNSVSATVRFQSRFVFYILVFVVAGLSLLDGIISIPCIIKKRKAKNDEHKDESEKTGR